MTPMTIASPVADYILNFKGFFKVLDGQTELVFNTWGLTVVALLLPALTCLTLFLYRFRVAQIRLSILNIVLMLGYYVVLGLVYYFMKAQVVDFTWSFNWPVVLPLINMILTYLALINIVKDDALVKSMDRLR